MADMHHMVQADGADAASAYTALTTRAGITGWWTSRAEVAGDGAGDRVGDLLSTQTGLRWNVEQTDGGTIVRLNHIGFPAVDALLSLKAYLQTGVRKPLFDC